MNYPFPYQPLESQIEEMLLSQSNKLLVDYKLPPGNSLSDSNERYDDSLLKRLRDDGTAPNLSETEIADLQYSRLIEVIRYEMVPILNLLDHAEHLHQSPPDFQVPLLYLVPAQGLAPVEYPEGRQNCQYYFYPVNMRLILNRDQSAFEGLTITATESLIRDGLKYVFDRSGFLHMSAPRAGYEIHSQVVNNLGLHRSTLEGFMSPWSAVDYTYGFIIEEQATLAANAYN